MYRFLLILFLCCCFHLASSQNQALDSLKSVLKSLPQDSNYVKTIHEISVSFIGSYPDSIIFYSGKGLLLAEKLGYGTGEAKANQLIGIAMYQKGIPNEAVEYYYKALAYFEKSKMYLNAGKTYNNIGLIYTQQGEKSRALNSYLKALEYLKKTNDENTRARILLNVANIYTDNGDLDSALVYHFKALEIAEAIGEDNTTALIMINIGSVYGRKEDLNEAIKYFEKALPLTQNPGGIQNEGYVLECIATAYEAKGDYKKAAEVAELGFAKMRKIDQKIYLSALSNKLYSIYSKDGQWKKALFYHERFKDISDSLKNNEQSLELIRLENKFEFEQKEEALKLAQLEENLKNEEHLKRQQLLSYLLGAILILLIIIFWAYYKYQQQKTRSHQLLEQKHSEIEVQALELEQLNSLKDKLFSIIAHDLRSPIASLQQVLDMIYQDYLSEEEKKQLLENLNKEVGQTSLFLDNLLQWAKSQIKGEKIHQETIDVAALSRSVVEGLQYQLAEKNLSVEINIPEKTKALADPYMIEIVIRNLLANAIKFSKKNGTIRVEGLLHENQVEVSVIDEGVGIKSENLPRLFSNEYFTTRGTGQEKGTGIGLMLCKEFVEKNQGQITVMSQENLGSSFVFTLPRAS